MGKYERTIYMRLVIDIPEEDYQNLKAKDKFDDMYLNYYEKLIVCGIPLLKGHGDLIDRRELKKEVYTTTEWNGDVHRIIYEASVDDAPTIIEADKESEGKE